MTEIHVPKPEKNWIVARPHELIEVSARSWVSNLPTVVLRYQDKFDKPFLVVRNIGAGPKYNVLEPLHPNKVGEIIRQMFPQATLVGYFPVNGLHLEFMFPTKPLYKSNMNIHGRRYTPRRSSFENEIYWIPMETR